jgi:hypothetical protein
MPKRKLPNQAQKTNNLQQDLNDEITPAKRTLINRGYVTKDGKPDWRGYLNE